MNYLNELLVAEFKYPLALWFLWLLIPFVIFGLYTRPKQALAHILRALSLALLLLALADPVKVNSSSNSELVGVFDVSASVSEAARGSMAQAVLQFTELENLNLKLIPFSKTVSANPISIDRSTSLKQLLGDLQTASVELDSGETNLGAGLKAALRGSTSSSVLIMSDGHETIGDTKPLMAEAKRKGVSFFPLIPNQKDFLNEKLSISSLHAPITARAGARADVGISIKNDFDKPEKVRVSLFMEEKKLLSQDIVVQGNRERLLQLSTPALEGGLKRLRAVLEPLGENGKFNKTERYRWLSVKEKSRIFLLSGEQSDARVISTLIGEKGYGVESLIADGRTEIPINFSKYSSIILNNVAKRQLPEGFLPALETFVSAGGGLLMLGGNRSYGLGEYIKTPLEKISPVKFLPPQTEKKRLTAAVVLVLDKSGSMVHQNKITAAKRAALLSVETLKDEDYVSVIGFDHAPFVIIDLQLVSEARPIAESRLRNLTAVGQTNLLPALAQARQMLTTVNASRKHIIVLSDGKFPLSSDLYIDEINRLRNGGVSVSAIALGIEADVPFMKLLANYGKGAFYETLDPNRLPQIFVEDIKVSTGEKTLQENRNFPVGIGPGGLVSTKVSRYRPLRGFVETLPKKGSTLELITKRRDKAFPILARWKYKKGVVIAFTSDANGRWSSPWLRWKDFPVFWGDVIDSVKNKAGNTGSDIDFDLRYSVNRKAIELDLAVYDSSLESKAAPPIQALVISPSGEPNEVTFYAKAKGRFLANLENARPGDYKLAIRYGDVQLPPLAITLPGDIFGEAPGRGANMAKLEALSSLTQGLVNPLPQQVPTAQRKLEQTKKLYIPLVVTAFFIILLEAFVRELWGTRRARFRPQTLQGNYSRALEK
jgi:uncharacterized membrane protein